VQRNELKIKYAELTIPPATTRQNIRFTLQFQQLLAQQQTHILYLQHAEGILYSNVLCFLPG
jgi:hypothetical protein